MAMPVVSIRKVWMRVDHGFVPVRMTMFSPGRHRIVVCVLVMFIVQMFVVVLHLFVHMAVLVALGQVQPRAQCHQGTGHEQR